MTESWQLREAYLKRAGVCCRSALLCLMLVLSGCGDEGTQFVDTGSVRHIIDNEKWMIINYWAVWCTPCRAEIPELNQLAREHSDLLVVYGVNFDQPDAEEMVSAVEKMGIEFPVFQNDPYQMLGYEQPQVLPTTIVMAPGNVVHGILIGPQTVESLLEAIEAG